MILIADQSGYAAGIISEQIRRQFGACAQQSSLGGARIATPEECPSDQERAEYEIVGDSVVPEEIRLVEGVWLLRWPRW